MTQYGEQFVYSLMIVWMAGFSLLYGLGGIHDKWIRRYLGTGWLTLGIVVFSLWLKNFHWAYLSFFPIAIAGCSIGYGQKYDNVRLPRRALQGLVFGLAPAALAIYNHAWGAWAFDMGLAIFACVVIGGLNVFQNSRKNEALISALSFFCVLFMVTKQ